MSLSPSVYILTLNMGNSSDMRRQRDGLRPLVSVRRLTDVLPDKYQMEIDDGDDFELRDTSQPHVTERGDLARGEDLQAQIRALVNRVEVLELEVLRKEKVIQNLQTKMRKARDLGHSAEEKGTLTSN